MATLIEEMKIRQGMESPKFFKKLGKIGRSITIIAGSISAVAAILATGGLAIPVVIPSVIGGIALLGETIKKVSDLAVEDKDELKEALRTDI